MADKITLSHNQFSTIDYGKIYLNLTLENAYGSAEIYPQQLTEKFDASTLSGMCNLTFKGNKLLMNAPMVTLSSYPHRHVIEWRNKLSLYRYGHMLHPHFMNDINLPNALTQIFQGYDLKVAKMGNGSDKKIGQFQPTAMETINDLLIRLSHRTGVIWHSKMDGTLGVLEKTKSQTLQNSLLEISQQKFLPHAYLHSIALNHADEWHPKLSESLLPQAGLKRLISEGIKPSDAQQSYEFLNPKQLYHLEYADIIPLIPGTFCNVSSKGSAFKLLQALVLESHFYHAEETKSRFVLMDATDLTL